MLYIQRRDENGLETVDEFCPETQTKAQLLQLLKEYRHSDSSAAYYSSSRPCKAWRDAKEANSKPSNQSNL